MTLHSELEVTQGH